MLRNPLRDPYFMRGAALGAAIACLLGLVVCIVMWCLTRRAIWLACFMVICFAGQIFAHFAETWPVPDDEAPDA